MDPAEPITKFTGPWRGLSNFVPATVALDGDVYPTVEHAYQAAKTLDAPTRHQIACADKPGTAKRLGRQVRLRDDWESLKVGIMLRLLRQKFADPEYRDLLLATGDAELVEGNTWGDMYWGKVPPTGRSEPFVHGLNVLGMLLEQVRGEIRMRTNPGAMSYEQILAVGLGGVTIGHLVRMERPKTTEELRVLGEPDTPVGMQTFVVGVRFEQGLPTGERPSVVIVGDAGLAMTVHDGDQASFDDWAWWVDGVRQADSDTSIQEQA